MIDTLLNPEELQLLLSVNTAIATIRDRKELFATIFEKIRPLLPVDDTGLLILDKTGNFWQDWTNVDNYQQTDGVVQAQQLGLDQFFPVDRWMTYALNQSGIISVTHFMQQYAEHPFGPMIWESGVREFIFTPLEYGGKKLGVLIFDSWQEETYTQVHIPLFKAIASQLAVAVANILANEELLQREQEKATLLSISQAIAAIHKKEELLQFIFRKVQPLFNFYDIGLSIISVPDNTITDWAVLMPELSPSATNQALLEAGLSTLPYQDSAIKKIIRDVEKAGKPVIISINEDSVRQFPDFKQILEIELSHGYKEMWFTCLKAGGKLLGTLNFNSLQANYFQRFDPQFFQAIADLVAIAVANILASEEILEREKEKSILLSISEGLATIRDKQQLLSVVFEKVRPLFGFHDTGFFVLDPNRQYIEDWSVVLPEVDSSEANSQLRDLGAGRIPFAGSAMEWAIHQLRETNGPRLFYYNEEVFRQFPDYPQFETIKQVGYQESIGALLRTDRQEIGILFFNSLQKGQFQTSQLGIFQSIADLIALAVANILAHEEILEREKEKAILLSISEDIAAVRNKEELLQLIIGKIKPLFHFYDCGILVIDNNGLFHDLAAIHPAIDNSEANHYLNQMGFYKGSGITYAGSNLEWLIAKLEQEKAPVVFDYYADYSAYTDGILLSVLKDLGYQESLFGLLKTGGKTFGCFSINYCNRQQIQQIQIPLFQNVVDQLSVAVANILAHEEILEREREKTNLLSISEALSRISNRKELFRVIYTHIRSIFSFDDTGLFLINEAENYHQLLIDYEMVGVPAEWQGSQERIPHRNSVIDFMAKGFGTIRMDELMDRFPGHPHYPVMRQAGFKEMIYGPLIYSGKTIGFLCFQSLQSGFYTNKDLRLFQNIANQLAVSVANILASEEILEREREKTNLLSISEAISKINNRKELLQVIYRHIQPLFPFDSAGLFVIDEQKDVIYEILDSEAFPDQLQKQLTEEDKLGPWKVSRSSRKSWWMQHTTVINSLQEEALYAKGFSGEEQFDAGMAYGLRHMIGGPMFANGKKIGAICFNSKKPDFYTGEHVSMFKSISGQVAVAVANILSNEEIAAREKIKTIQIETGQALAEETQWKNRLLRCARLLQKEIPHAMFLTSILMEDNEFLAYGFYQTGREEYQVLEKEDLLRIVGSNADLYKQYLQYVVKDLTGPVAYGQHEIDSLQKIYPVKQRFMNYFRLRHTLIFPMRLSNNKVVVLTFYTKADLPYKASHVQLMNDIRNYIGLCFDRVLAFDELEKANQRISQENRYLQEEIKNEHNFDSIIGESRVLKEVFKNISLVASTDTTVLVLGETGTGKELIARSLHNSSPRAKNSFIKINCAALPAQLIESELFGHEKGSFTGAYERRIGKFELADGGSIFLDEIGELPLELQSKLLRVLQEKEFERIGGKQTLKCDVRIIAATNRKLETEVENGRFRADLYYRLNVFPILLPPLRDRKEDIPLLATYFAHKFCKKMNKPFKGISTDMLEALASYQWPGNIRELENVMEQAVIVSPGTSALELARQLLFVGRKMEEERGLPDGRMVSGRTLPLVKEEREKMEIQAIMEALQKSKGRIRGNKGAAQLLDIQPTTLESKMKKYGISKYAFG